MAYNPNRRYPRPPDEVPNHVGVNSYAPHDVGHVPPSFPSPQPGSPGLRQSNPLGANGLPRNGEIHHQRGNDFDKIRINCLKQGRLYEDPDFLPSPTSIYYSRRPPISFEWKRPGEIASLYRARPGFFVGDVDRFDVKQGKVGDCWLVAAIACLANPDYRELFHKVVPSDQSFQDGWYTGMFHFNFWHFGKWIQVIIDDLLPTSRGELLFVHSSQPFEFWAALLEKAYAKLYGSYETLKGGVMADSLTDFTGGLTESYILRGKHANVPQNIVNILFKALDRQSLIGCGIDPLDPRGGMLESKLPNGLVAGHAYSVTDLREILVMSDRGQVPVTLIRIRNPWGTRTEWTGSWNDRSHEWRSIPAHERDRMGLVQRDDGEFWMEFRDFMENFDNISICNLSPESPVEMARHWHVAEHHGKWQKGFNAGGRPYCRDSHWANPQYFVRLYDTDEDDDRTCSFIIQLMQKDRRKIKQKGEKYHYIGFVIYKFVKGYSLPLTKDFFERNRSVASCDSFINSRQIVKRFNMPPGEYVVIPCTYEEGEVGDFYIRFFFEKGNVAEYADEAPEKVDVPPPVPSEEIRDQEEQFKTLFYKMAGEDMEVNPYELKIALDDALKKEPLHKDIGIDACKSFISLMDVDNSGRLGFTEFSFLWHHLRNWKKVFYQFDANKSGMMNSRELRRAIPAAGYKVNNKTLAALVFRYGNEHNRIDLDNFLICMARLMKLFNVYSNYEQEGHVVFTLEQWLEQSVY